MDTLEATRVLFRGCPFFGGRNVWTIYRQGVNSVSIVGRLPTLQSVHYQRFHCTTDLLLRKREDPEQRSFPSAIIAILSPNKSASSLQTTTNNFIMTFTRLPTAQSMLYILQTVEGVCWKSCYKP